MSKINLTKARFEDIEFLWYLRNRPELFKFFGNPAKVSWEEHLNWIMPILLGFSEKEIFVIELEGRKVGQIRLDFGQGRKEAIVSISLCKEFHGKGIAAQALKMAFKKEKGVRIIAEIHKDNLASLKLFEKMGFKQLEKKEFWLKFVYEN